MLFDGYTLATQPAPRPATHSATQLAAHALPIRHLPRPEPDTA